jgi:integrase/recombinase XerD
MARAKVACEERRRRWTERLLSEWVMRFDRHLEARNFSLMTRRQYKHRLGMFVRWAQESQELTTPQQVSPEVVGDYQAYLSEIRRRPRGGPLAVGTQLQCLAPLKSFFRWLHNRAMIKTDPAAELMLPIKRKTLPRDVPTIREIRYVVQSILRSDCPFRLRNAAIVAMLFASGCRKMELTRLRLEDLDLKNREIRIEKAKNRTGRITFIAPWVVPLIEAYLQYERPLLASKSAARLFLSRYGVGFTECGVGILIRRRFRKIPGIRTTCHGLRHAFCISLLRGGGSISVIAELAGHRRLASTAIYTRLELPDLRKVHSRAFK